MNKGGDKKKRESIIKRELCVLWRLAALILRLHITHINIDVKVHIV